MIILLSRFSYYRKAHTKPFKPIELITLVCTNCILKSSAKPPNGHDLSNLDIRYIMMFTLY